MALPNNNHVFAFNYGNNLSSQNPIPDSQLVKLSSNVSRIDDELRIIYGDDAIIFHNRQFTFVHLDYRSPELIHAREKFRPDELFAAGCRWCSE